MNKFGRRLMATPLAVLIPLAVPVLMLWCSILAAPAVAAALTHVSCVGTTDDSYNPGLTNQQQDVDFHAQDTYSPCTSSDQTLTAGGDTFEGNLPLSCLQPVLTGSYKLEVQWNNGRSSELALTTSDWSSVEGEIVVTVVGDVSGGEFRGDTVAAQWTQATLDPIKCASPGGVTSATGTATLLITGL